ncbi:MAG: hypothetical protein JWN14_4263 [Chthonomonadales bacterium]|nr:hypothetical protein [Chthonomonadales bacterium]
MPPEEFDFETILKVLAKHQVEFIIVGGLCAVLHGVPLQTYDLDIVHSRTSANLERLESALLELGACYREHLPRRLVPEATRMTTAGRHLLQTSAGPLDVLGAIADHRDYDALLPYTTELALDETTWIRILDLATLILTKQETGRLIDRTALPILERTLEEIERNTE